MNSIKQIESDLFFLRSHFCVDPTSASGLRMKKANGAYNPKTMRKAGDVAGYPDEKNYWRIGISGVYPRVSRIIWILLHGEIPAGMRVDHKDCNPLNNHPSNLQLLTHPQNVRATSNKSTRNSSGFLGVFKRRDRRNAWLALMRRDGKLHYLGSFSNPVLAARRYNEAVIKWAKEHGETPRYLNPV